MTDLGRYDHYTDSFIQEPCEDMEREYEKAKVLFSKVVKSEDCISRQTVLDMLEDINAETDGVGFYYEHYVDYIKALPSVKPQEKTGHWIEHPEIETTTPEYLMFYECSECGDKPCFCKSDIHKKRFCSNCGAKMVEPKESEEI